MMNIATWIITEKNKNNPYALDTFSDFTADHTGGGVVSDIGACIVETDRFLQFLLLRAACAKSNDQQDQNAEK